MRTGDEALRAAQDEHRAASDHYTEVSRRCRADEQRAQTRLIAATRALRRRRQATKAGGRIDEHPR